MPLIVDKPIWEISIIKIKKNKNYVEKTCRFVESLQCSEHKIMLIYLQIIYFWDSRDKKRMGNISRIRVEVKNCSCCLKSHKYI